MTGGPHLPCGLANMKSSTLSGGTPNAAPQVCVGLLRPLPGISVRPQPDREQLHRFLEELQLPLRASGSMLDLLEDTELTEPVAMALAALRNHNDYLRKLVDDYGTCSRLEQDGVVPQLASCDTLAWLDDFFMAQRQHAAGLGLDLIVKLRSFVPDWIVFDPVLVAKAFEAMLHVAMQRSLPTQLAVSVRYVESRPPSEPAQLVIECQTRGGGFDEIELGYVFAPFQVRDAAARPLLGISLGQRFAELAGGGLSVESTSPSTCTYRMSVCAEPVARAKWLDPVARTGHFGPVRPGRVLFVGRCERTVRRCTAALERAGYSIDRAEREELALPRIEEQPERWSAIVVDATCTGERLLGFVDATRARGFGGRMIALVEDVTEANRAIPGVDRMVYAPSGSMMLQVLRCRRARP